MNTNTLTDSAALDFDSGSAKRRWWNPFTRAERDERTDRPRREWFGKRRQAMAEMREEQRRLIETLEKLSDRLNIDTAAPAATGPAMEIDPMPVIRGIESISTGQKEISVGLAGLSRHMERADATHNRLNETVSRVGETLDGVRVAQANTATAVSQVGDRIHEVTARFESLFRRMQEAELQMAADYRKLQTRTVMAVSGIAATAAAVALTFFLTGPWG
jgi:methyl-accepting chemotaxis protein